MAGYSSDGPSSRGVLSAILPPLAEPFALLTTIDSPKPVEFITSQAHHNFNCQLSSAVIVNTITGSRGRTQLVVPGHTSLITADEPFRCVVWPAAQMLTLHVMIPPEWIASVREEEISGRPRSGDYLCAEIGVWDHRLRNVSLQLAEALRFSGATDRLRLDQLYLALAVALVCRHDGSRAQLPGEGRMAAAKLRQVIEYLHAHVGDNIAIRDLADVT